MSHIKDKNLALLAYLSALLLYVHLILFIAVLGIAIIMNNGKNNDFVAFHIRQMLGLGVIAVFISVFARTIPEDLYWLAYLIITLLVILAMLGLASAIKNQKDKLPFLGNYFQQWFSFVK
jgi:uncharacterized membrane protein